MKRVLIVLFKKMDHVKRTRILSRYGETLRLNALMCTRFKESVHITIIVIICNARDITLFYFATL
jgi:hypothetical protein